MDGLNFSLSETHRIMLEVVRGVLRELEPRRDDYLKQIYEQQRFPDAVWDAMAEAGIIGALVPEDYGGSGVGLLGMTLALEEFASVGLINAFCILNSMANMALLRGGSAAQKAHWLPKVANGSVKFAFAITEPDAGTNSFRLRSLARRDGEVYRLTGNKGWITGVDRADYILVVARSVPYKILAAQSLPKTHGLALFIVDANAPGLTKQVMDTTGVEGFRQFLLYFDNVEVPVERRIGEEQQGAAVLFATLNPERVLAAAAALGMSEFALRKAIDYARQRKVFGDTAIGAYQAVQHPLARVKIAQESARLLTYKAAWLYDQGVALQEAGHYANMAKHQAAEMVLAALDAAIQTHGGCGFVRDYQLINLWAPARLFKTAPINNEMILNQLAEHLLGLPRSY